MSSRLLTYVLRHHPESVGLTLDAGGWVAIDELLAALAAHGRLLDRSALDHIVATSDKRRFEVHNGRIRAAQGHSVTVDLGLPPATPPAVLYHGTVARFLAAIEREGLRPGRRQYVHLSPDVMTARAVGARRGEPVILRVDAAALHADGQLFYQAANGVWLTDHVPPDRLRPLSTDPDRIVDNRGSADADSGPWTSS
jgi:putative RNA 2'-phosphotransferase